MQVIQSHLAPPDIRHAGDTSLLLVEEHALVRAALRSLLDATAGLTVVAEAEALESAAELASTLRPNVVLVSAAPDVGRGLPAMRSAAPDACVIVLTRGATPIVPAPPGSAASYLPSHTGLTDLCSAIEAAVRGRCRTCAFNVQCPVPKTAARLSRRETQVAVRIADGMTSKQIAAELGVGLRTVHTYREALARKLGGSSAAIVTRYVLERGVTSRRDVA